MRINGIILLFLTLPVVFLQGEEGRLRAALTHHVSFDHSLQADYSRGDLELYERKKSNGVTETTRAVADQSLDLVATDGKHAGSLMFVKTGSEQFFYQNPGVLNYSIGSWSGTVSVWLRVNPDEDIPAGYSDPIMVTADDMKSGFMFLEWSPDVPRRFRFAILPRQELWNPSGAGWEKIPAERRPMVEMPSAPFSRDRWTHVVFSFEKINEGTAAIGRLYVDGHLQGEIKGWNQSFGWDPAKVRLVIGRSYVGGMDDLAVFNRALEPSEIKTLHGLPGGVRSLFRR